MIANGSNGALPPEIALLARVQMAGVWGGGRPRSLPPAGQVAPSGGAARTAFFSALQVPMQNGTGKAPGAKA